LLPPVGVTVGGSGFTEDAVAAVPNSGACVAGFAAPLIRNVTVASLHATVETNVGFDSPPAAHLYQTCNPTFRFSSINSV
jgi:hypothetical protein